MSHLPSDLNLTTHRASTTVWDRRGWDGARRAGHPNAPGRVLHCTTNAAGRQMWPELKPRLVPVPSPELPLPTAATRPCR